MPLRSMLTSACCLLFLLTCSHCSKNSTDPPPGNNGPDTTSHNFIWQIDTLGDLTSFLTDVSAISEDDIWVGGKIIRNDTIYNALHWDGQDWEWQRVAYDNSLGVPLVVDTDAIFAFSSSEVWTFAVSGAYGFWNGLKWSTEYITQRQGSITRIWGVSDTDITFVGTNGNITQFDGTTWSLEASSTTIDLLDIAGSMSEYYKWTCGYTSNGSESILLFYDGTTWQTRWHWNNQTGATDSTFAGL